MGRLGVILSCLAGAALLCALICGCGDSKAKSSVKQITFYEHVAPIVWKNCATCHRKGEIAPFELTTYEQVKKHASQIAKMTASRFMPPWLPEKGFGEFADERRLSEEEIDLIAEWVRGGCIEGNAGGLKPPQFAEGWQLGKPDLVAEMPGTYLLAADGRDVYRNFVVPLETIEP